MIWTGRILSGLAVAFLAFDGISKFFLDRFPPDALAAITSLGWSVDRMPIVGTLLLICVGTYLIPRTSIVGAVLLTGYLGGAVATHLRIGNPLFTHTLSAVYVAVLVWLGLYLRDPRVRVMIGKTGSDPR